MFGRELKKLLPPDPETLNFVRSITQHEDRPPANRGADQIYMHTNSQFIQARLVADYVSERDVVFVGDGDCMSLVLGALAAKGYFPPPEHMMVFDFDQRVLQFIKKAAREFKCSSFLEVFEPWYNVKYPVPKEHGGRYNVFYTNPPYGSKNNGESVKAFLGRCIELTRPAKSWGCAILPFQHDEPWTRNAMLNIQSFLVQQGFVVTEMLRELHAYDLDDAPWLLSSTVILDRVENVASPYAGRLLKKEEMRNFYGQGKSHISDYVDLEGNKKEHKGRLPG